jgi:hypothetical protein
MLDYGDGDPAPRHPLVLTVSGPFPQAVVQQPKIASGALTPPATTREGIVKHSLGAVVAVTAIIWAVGSALAADLPLRAVVPADPAQEVSGKQISYSVVGNTVAGHWSAREQRADRRVTVAPSQARDNHIVEFLRWKEQQSAMNGRAIPPSR